MVVKDLFVFTWLFNFDGFSFSLASSVGTPPAMMMGAPLVPLGMVSTGAVPPMAMHSAAPTVMATVTQPTNQPLVQPMMQQMMTPMMQPTMQSIMHPTMQPIMQPTMQPMMQPVVSSNLPLLMQGTGSPVGLPLTAINLQSPAGMISPPSTATAVIGSGFPASSASFDGSKPNTPDSSKTVVRAPSVASRES